jgi:hypothetical protein
LFGASNCVGVDDSAEGVLGRGVRVGCVRMLGCVTTLVERQVLCVFASVSGGRVPLPAGSAGVGIFCAGGTLCVVLLFIRR